MLGRLVASMVPVDGNERLLFTLASFALLPMYFFSVIVKVAGVEEVPDI